MRRPGALDVGRRDELEQDGGPPRSKSERLARERELLRARRIAFASRQRPSDPRARFHHPSEGALRIAE